MDAYQEALIKMTELIRNRSEIVEIKKVEDEIFSNKDILPFIINFNKMQEEYDFVLNHFKNDEEKVNIARKNLIYAKRKMDKLELIKKYNELYEIIIKDTLYLETKLKEIINDGDNIKC